MPSFADTYGKYSVVHGNDEYYADVGRGSVWVSKVNDAPASSAAAEEEAAVASPARRWSCRRRVITESDDEEPKGMGV